MLLKSVLISSLNKAFEQLYEQSCVSNGIPLQSFTWHPLNWMLNEIAKEDSPVLSNETLNHLISECREVEFDNLDGWLWSEVRFTIQDCMDKHSIYNMDWDLIKLIKELCLLVDSREKLGDESPLIMDIVDELEDNFDQGRDYIKFLKQELEAQYPKMKYQWDITEYASIIRRFDEYLAK